MSLDNRPPVSWEVLERPIAIAQAGQPMSGTLPHHPNFPATGGGIRSLMQWGPSIMFQVHPLNFHELDHETGTDWAHKEIAGAAIYREWVGELDESIHLRGRLFPYRVGGMPQIEVFDSQRRDGIANMLMRGDGRPLGWFVCEKLIRNETFISFEGVGQMINFEAQMTRVPVPDSATYMTALWKAGGLP